MSTSLKIKQIENTMRTKKITVIGCGGLGTACILSLLGAYLGTLVCIDGDKVDKSNLHRQFIYTEEDIGKYKADCIYGYITKRMCNTNCILYTLFCESNTQHEYQSDLETSDLIIDCTDNAKARLFISRWCKTYRKPYLFGSALGLDGQLMCITPKTGCLECAFPEIRNVTDTCTDNGILSSVVNTVGHLQSTLAIKYLCGVGDLHLNKMLHYSSMDGTCMYYTYHEGECLCEDRKIEETIEEIEVEYKDIYTQIGKNVVCYVITGNGEVDLDEIAYSRLYRYELSYESIQSFLEQSVDNKVIIVCQRGLKSKEECLIVRKVCNTQRIYSIKDGISSIYGD